MTWSLSGGSGREKEENDEDEMGRRVQTNMAGYDAGIFSLRAISLEGLEEADLETRHHRVDAGPFRPRSIAIRLHRLSLLAILRDVAFLATRFLTNFRYIVKLILTASSQWRTRLVVGFSRVSGAVSVRLRCF